jgi:hypothetical protein
MIQPPRLSTVGAMCGISTVACFVLGAISMGSSGVQLLIPETGEPGLEWIADVDAAGGLFFTGAWLIILMGFLGIVALVGSTTYCATPAGSWCLHPSSEPSG